MAPFIQAWSRLGSAARTGLIAAIGLLVVFMAVGCYWLLQPDYQVLFGDLSQADAAAMTAELDHMKVPYKLDHGGGTILVEADQVYKTRLKLAGRDIPLHGTVGFELFSNSDVGMTDFAQKVNYQRALQGELTRTMLAIEEVQAVRVHLALPEQTLFKKTGATAKASISVTLKPGKVLVPAQVAGIQRLVAAAVPDVHVEDVTVVDQHGVALTRSGGDAEQAAAGLDGKQSLEAYLTHKVSEVLDRSFGAGQGIATVDVMLSHEQTKTTTENVLGGAPNPDTGESTGVLVRSHEISHDVPSNVPAGDPRAEAGGSSNRDAEYQVGRRVEQVVSNPGGISRINVAVVLKQSLDNTQIEHIRELVGLAVGINKARGDGIAVYSLNQIGNGQPTPATSATANVADATDSPVAQGTQPALTLEHRARDGGWVGGKNSAMWWALGLLLLTVCALVAMSARRSQPTGLAPREREVVLQRVRQWLDEPAAGAEGGKS
jgi:flagellar M-ring protein FliF